MSIRRTGLLLLSVLLVPGAAHATGHNADGSGGFSGAAGSKFWGFHSIVAAPLHKPANPRNLSLLFDFSVYDGSENGSDQKLYGYLGGLRWTFGDQKNTPRKVMASVHTLIGTMHTAGGGSPTSYATGGAVDVMLGAPTMSEAGWGVRFLADYVTRQGAAHNLTRVSVELVKRWGHHHQ